MALPKQRENVVDDIYALPEGERAELIDGEIYYMAPPNRRHQEIVGELFGTIREYIRGQKGACRVYTAPFAVFLNKDERNYVEPDISVICDRGKLHHKGCMGAPDWVIEVVAPGSRSMDYYRKLFKYRAAGVREYWIVDAERNLVTVYDFENDSAANYTFRDSVPAGIYPGFAIDFSALDLDEME